MLSDKVRILNFDDSIIKQSKLIQCYQPTVIDLKPIGSSCRHWMNKKIAEEIRDCLNPEFRNAITFLGSGDFHHVSSLLIGQFEEPLTVIIFDYHPDWDILPPRLGCGSWVSAALRKEQVVKCLLLGVSSEDISSLSMQTGNLAALKNDRVEIYPYFHPPSRIFFKRVPENASIKVRNGIFFSTICWTELKTKHLGDFFKSILSRIPTKKVYLSIDKDCLQAAYAATNWEEGQMPLDELLLMLRMIKEEKEIIGADIVGDYSPVLIDGWFKRKCSKFDHPKKTSATGMAPEGIQLLNELTNMKIMEVLVTR